MFFLPEGRAASADSLCLREEEHMASEDSNHELGQSQVWAGVSRNCTLEVYKMMRNTDSFS